VAKEGEAQLGIVADALQTVFGKIGGLADGVGVQVREFLQFDSPYLLGRIKVRSLARQWLDAQPIALAGEPLSHASGCGAKAVRPT
jgi:hypothetical protein